MLLTGHKTRAIFDRYNIINEHELLEAGDQLVASLALHAPATNAFALSIKADFEPPKQALFLMDKRRGRTCTWPILFQP